MGDPEKTDPVAVAVEKAADTGAPVVIDELTTESTILVAQPDGMVEVEAASGPKRVAQEDGSWAELDTTLEVTENGVAPKMVPGDTLFSAGGDDLLAALGDGEGTSVTMTWPGGKLPEPVLDGDTATYPDVLPDVDLVLTANPLGFSQLLVVNSRPDAATAETLSTLDIPVVTTGADLVEGAGGQLQVQDEDSGELLGVAAAPLMWDARVNPRTDEPVALRQMGVAVEDETGAPVIAGGPEAVGEEVTLVLEPDMSLFTAPDTVYPVTIDPTQTLGAIGDSFVQSNIATTPQGGATELRTGTYDGGATVARSYLRFDVSALKNRDVQSATLSLWNFHSWSCTPRWTDIRDVPAFNPDTITWNNQPALGGIVANHYGAMGFSSACPAGWMGFDMTNWARVFADNRNNRPNTMHLAVTVENERDNVTWKKFSSGNGMAGPAFTFTFDGNCSLYNGYRVCGAIRDKYLASGGPSGPLGMPTTSETPIYLGAYNHFQGGSIYNSLAGTYIVKGAIRDRWAQVGWEKSPVGYPIGDELCGLRDGGCKQHFERGSTYVSWGTGAWDVAGKIRDKWEATGRESGPLGYPTSGPRSLAGGNAFQTFAGDGEGEAIMYLAAGAPAAYYVKGPIRDQFGALGWEKSYLGFPTSDPYNVLGGQRSDFQGGQITQDAETNATQWGAGPSTWAGQPGWATNLSFLPTDRITADVNVGTGNLNLTVAGLAVPGVGGNRGIGVVYNSLHTAIGSVDPTGLLGPGFRLTESPDMRLIPYSDSSVRYLDATGRAAVFEWNASANRYDNTVGDGGWRLERNAANDWVLTELASNRKMTFRSSDGLLITDADRNGLSATFTYDSSGKLTGITGTRGGSAVTFTYGGTGVPAGKLARTSQTVGGSTRSVAFGYTNDQLTSITDPAGDTTQFAWTGNDLTRITAPAGGVHAVSYDTSHRVAQYVADYGSGRINSTTRLAWDADGNALRVKVTDPNNNVTTYRGDVFGKILNVADPQGHTQKATYSPNNDVVAAVDGMLAANTTTFSYNGADGGFTPTGVSMPTGASYPGTGTGPLRYLPTSSTDTQGNVTNLSYDAAGNPTRQTSGGVTTSTTYNPPVGQAAVCNGGGKAGQPCTQTDGRGSVTTFSYDSAGNLRTVTPPAGVIKATTYTYDDAGRPKTMTDGKGQVTTYVYDGADRVTQIRYDGASSCLTPADCQRYTYDGNGNLTTRSDAAGTTTFGYDRLNRLTEEASPAASGGGSQISGMSYDLAGNLLTFTDATGTTRYGYDASENLVNLAEPGGSCTGVISRCTTYTYDSNDIRTKIMYPGGTVVEMLDIDAAGRALRHRSTAGGHVVMDLRYSFANSSGDTGLLQTRTDATVPGNAVQAYSGSSYLRWGLVSPPAIRSMRRR
ncbi:hypothetical protein DQ239_19310 [Blastococcus sp. TF02-09]|nr:hypothetical protein DQ239_19310 [Blastococcus sp. TF02-9]